MEGHHHHIQHDFPFLLVAFLVGDTDAGGTPGVDRPESCMNDHVGKVLVFISFFFVSPAPALANTGLTTVGFTFPQMLLALLLIVAIESAVYTKTLQIKFKEGLIPSAVANLTSTLVGFPLTLLLLLGFAILASGGRALETGTSLGEVIVDALQTSWQVGYDPYVREDFWSFLAGVMLRLIPAYLLSLLIEYLILKGFSGFKESVKLKKAVLIANTVTYGMLVLVVFLAYFWLPPPLLSFKIGNLISEIFESA